MTPRVALVTYSTKPRGGVVHTLSLAEALAAGGSDVTVIALGDPDRGFFRPVAAPWRIVPAPPPAETLEERVFRSVDALHAGLSSLAGEFDILHTQDCIAARAAVRASGGIPVVRTVHHIDDFTTPALIDCQRQAILEPDIVLVVSRYWQSLLADEYGVEAQVVHNGVDRRRFRPIEPERRDALRCRIGAGDRFLFLAVGGIEPRKGSVELLGALGRLQPTPLLAIIGGHSFQDYAAYREAALGSLASLGLELGKDVVLLGTVDDEELPGWYGAADALAFPSVKEGWGLAVLEAMSAGLPVVATDIPVFREYLTDGRDALLVPPGDVEALAKAMQAMVADEGLRNRLRAAGGEVAARFTWESSAAEHRRIYEAILARGGGRLGSMGVVDDVIRAYDRAWNAPDLEERRRLLEVALTEDCELVEPRGRFSGRDAILERITGFANRFPGARVDISTGIDEHNGLARYGWTIVDREGTLVLDGIDVVERAADGRLRRIVMFFGPL